MSGLTIFFSIFQPIGILRTKYKRLNSSFLKKTLLDDQFWIETFIDLLKIGNTHGLFDSIYKRKFLFQYILQKRISFNEESTDKTYFERRFAW